LLLSEFSDKPHLLVDSALDFLAGLSMLIHRGFRVASDINGWFYKFKARCVANRMRYRRSLKRRERLTRDRYAASGGMKKSDREQV